MGLSCMIPAGIQLVSCMISPLLTLPSVMGLSWLVFAIGFLCFLYIDSHVGYFQLFEVGLPQLHIAIYSSPRLDCYSHSFYMMFAPGPTGNGIGQGRILYTGIKPGLQRAPSFWPVVSLSPERLRGICYQPRSDTTQQPLFAAMPAAAIPNQSRQMRSSKEFSIFPAIKMCKISKIIQ